MSARERYRQLALAQAGRGGVPATGAGGLSVGRSGHRDVLRRGRASHRLRAPYPYLPTRLPPADRAGGVCTRGHHLRPEYPCRGDGYRRARELRAGLPAGDRMDTQEPACLPNLRRREQPVVCVPRQQLPTRSHPCRLPLPRRAARHEHGDNESRHGGTVCGHPYRPARSHRGLAFQPLRGCYGATDSVRGEGAAKRAGNRRQSFRAAGRQREGAERRQCNRPDKRLAERRRCATASGDRRPARVRQDGGGDYLRPADGRHEPRGRTVRRGQDVPAAGGEDRAHDEAGGGYPHPLSEPIGRRFRNHLPRQDSARHGERRCA